MSKVTGYIKNCFIQFRKGDESNKLNSPIQLDGYAIVPLEEYEKYSHAIIEWRRKNVYVFDCSDGNTLTILMMEKGTNPVVTDSAGSTYTRREP